MPNSYIFSEYLFIHLYACRGSVGSGTNVSADKGMEQIGVSIEDKGWDYKGVREIF